MRDLGNALLPSPALLQDPEHQDWPGIRARLQALKIANYEIFEEAAGREAVSNYEKFGRRTPSCIRKYEGFGENPLPCALWRDFYPIDERCGGMAVTRQGAQSRQL